MRADGQNVNPNLFSEEFLSSSDKVKVSGSDKARGGDRIINNVETDYKSLEPTTGPSAFKNRTKNSIKGGGQGSVIIFDARKTSMSEAEVRTGMQQAIDYLNTYASKSRTIKCSFGDKLIVMTLN